MVSAEHADEEDQESHGVEQHEPDPLLRLDDVVQVERAGQDQDADDAQAQRQLVADHLCRRAQGAQERVLALRSPAAQGDAVHPQRRGGEQEQYAGVGIHDRKLDGPSEKLDGRAHRDAGEGRQGHEQAGDGRELVGDPVGLPRDDVLFDDDLHRVGHRLEKPPRPCPVGAQPQLEVAEEFPLKQHQEREDGEQDHDPDDGLEKEQQYHLHLSSPPRPPASKR